MGIVIFLGFILFLRDKQKKRLISKSGNCASSTFSSIPTINPATGLPMLNSSHDIAGNFFGFNDQD